MVNYKSDKLLTLVAASAVFLLAIVLFAKNRPTNQISQNSQTQTTPSNSNQATSVPAISTSTTPVITSTSTLYNYLEVVDGCGPFWEGGECVNMRSGPGTKYPVVRRLRNGIILKIATTTVNKKGEIWYKIGFDGGIRYPERMESGWYVAAGDYLRVFQSPGESIWKGKGPDASSTKLIIVDRSKEMLYAYDGDKLFMEAQISVGLTDTPTPRGTFWVYRKMPDAYMQGPIPGITTQYYDLPGVPWDLFFTFQGGAIHGAYWHNSFGRPWSHGCVNMRVDEAEMIYNWADLGTPVKVID